MLANGFKVDVVSRSPVDGEILARLGGDIISRGLRLLQRDAGFQPANGPDGEAIAIGGIVGQAIGYPDVRCSLFVRLRREVQAHARRQHSDYQYAGLAGAGEWVWPSMAALPP